MLSSIVILSPTSIDSDDLHRACEAEVSKSGSVSIVNSIDALITTVTDELREQVALVPLRWNGHNGLDVIAQIRAVNPDATIVIVADKGDVDVAAEAIAAGANDFLVQVLPSSGERNVVQYKVSLLGGEFIREGL